MKKLRTLVLSLTLFAGLVTGCNGSDTTRGKDKMDKEQVSQNEVKGLEWIDNPQS